MEGLETWQYLTIALLFVWGGFVRSGLGFGGAVLTLPFLLLVHNEPLVFLPWRLMDEFLHRYNLWLFDPAHPQRLAAMPKAGDSPGFLRLPTELEWEFAATVATEKSETTKAQVSAPNASATPMNCTCASCA